MVAFISIFGPLFLLAPLGVFPIQHPSHLQFRDSFGTLVETPIGTAQGTEPVNGISRFAVKYASAQRWQNSVAARKWELPYESSTQPVDHH